MYKEPKGKRGSPVIDVNVSWSNHSTTGLLKPAWDDVINSTKLYLFHGQVLFYTTQKQRLGMFPIIDEYILNMR